jgi:hypothetical protein
MQVQNAGLGEVQPRSAASTFFVPLGQKMETRAISARQLPYARLIYISITTLIDSIPPVSIGSPQLTYNQQGTGQDLLQVGAPHSFGAADRRDALTSSHDISESTQLEFN